jgi:Fe(3+) dicitrate transport protein
MKLSKIQQKNQFYNISYTLFIYLALFFLSTSTKAQTKISGIITSDNGQIVSSVEIYNKNSGTKYFSNAKGEFAIELEKSGNYELVFYKENYTLLEKTVGTSSERIVIILDRITNLSEVVIRKQKEKLFALNKLKDIEETAIYAGKKTEVISISKLTANKATNNARQIFAQVVGLTINESSDGGLQLSIGGRGLDPNRTSNFNTRQNSYDISADVLGYPESYYAPPTEALEEIQVIRGAASLQYGTQFGGLINFKLKTPTKKPFEFVTRNTIGSYNLYTNFSSLSGTNGKFSYYTFYNFKKGDGFRPNSEFKSNNYFANLNYQFTPKTSLHFDYTHFDYLAQQAGGLTDEMFEQDATQSNRTRNWFDVNWNLFALRFKHKFDNHADFSLQLFGLDASRKTVGFRPERIDLPDPTGTVRDLISGDFVNWGAEARYLKRYTLNANSSAFLIGAKYYQANNTGIQGPGSAGSDANFNLATDEFPFYSNQSDYKYPNLNFSVFGENIFKVTTNFSITPGFRIEKIKTQAVGSYRKINLDLAGNVIMDKTIYEDIVKDRNFILLGIGLSYKKPNGIEYYGNISQNYRSVTFNDIRTVNSNQAISPDLSDEKGYTSDIGVRGQINDQIKFDSSIYALYYNDKIGTYPTEINNEYKRLRDNIGTAITYGFETIIDWSVNKTFFKEDPNFIWNAFSNIAITDSEYLKSKKPDIEGNEVEFVPLYNIKIGTGIGYENFMSSVQLTYISDQFTDAANSEISTYGIKKGITGPIPAYYVADISTSYKWKKWKLEAGITNFTNNSYFTRRATGYPGPGIIPSDTRTFYTTLEFVF